MVTTDELKDLAYLPGEIADLDREINELKHPPYLGEMSGSMRADYIAAIRELLKILHKRRRKCVEQLEKLRAFMDSIDDQFVYELFRLRYACDMGWPNVSRIITERGFYYEECSLRMICRRYLERYNKNEKEKGKAAAVRNSGAAASGG